MATRVTLPLLGQTMEEGTITRWLKQEGESVEKGEPLLEVMTDKANMEVESPASGILRKITAPPDTVVPIRSLIAVIGSADEPIDSLLAEEAAPAEAQAGASSQGASELREAPPSSASGASDRVFASPRARKLAAEKGVDIAALAGTGTGPEGRVVEKDVAAFAELSLAAPRVTPLAGKVAAEMGVSLSSLSGTGASGKITRDDVLRAATPAGWKRPSIGRVIPVSGIRKSVADNVSYSIRTAPHVTLVSEVDMTECWALREQLLPEVQKRHGVKLSYTAIITRACALAILDHPIVNSSLSDNQVVIHEEINIGIAVSLEGGLTVPVVKRAEAKPLHQISEEIDRLAARARSGNLTSEEMQGGTFTISNLGAQGVDVFNPIIRSPESAILGVCRTVERPVVIAGQVQPRRMMNLCLSFDHRVMDGVPAAEYLARVKQILESPYLLLI